MPSDCLSKGKCTSNAQLKWILIGLAVADIGCVLLRRLMVHLSKPSLQYLSLFDPSWLALNIIPRSGQVNLSELNITRGNFKVNPAAAKHVTSFHKDPFWKESTLLPVLFWSKRFVSSKTALHFPLSETVLWVCIINSFAGIKFPFLQVMRCFLTHTHIQCPVKTLQPVNKIFSPLRNTRLLNHSSTAWSCSLGMLSQPEKMVCGVLGGKPRGNSVFNSMYSTYKYHNAFKNCPFSFNLATLEYCNNRSIWCQTVISERSTYLSDAYMHAMEGEKKCVMIIHCSDNENERQKRFYH